LAPSIVTKKKPKAVRFGQCEPLPKKEKKPDKRRPTKWPRGGAARCP